MGHISLIGFMGSGKSSVGKELAKLLPSMELIDLDTYIEAMTGRNIPEIFENEGVTWLSGIISNNPNLSEVSLHTNTIYYLEEYILSYVKKMNFSFRTNTDAKKKAMIILDYLVSKGSTLGFLLREEIL